MQCKDSLVSIGKAFSWHCQVNRLPRVQATPLSIQTWFY